MAYTTINKSTDYFNTKLYTGNGSTNAITGVGFQPDLLWFKNRNSAINHMWFDSVRGIDKYFYGNLNEAEGTSSSVLTAVGSDGFTVGANNNVNGSGNGIASWNWKANGTGSANTQGDIASTVSANTTSGFSIVSYTGTGSNATVGHGLGSAPSMIIIKNRSVSSGFWRVYHSGLNSNNKNLKLNATNAEATDSSIWNDTSPTNVNFSVGTSSDTNGSGNAMIAYCFAEKQGYSKFGSYTGNGSADGTFVYTGFSPAFVIVKKTNGTDDWRMFDNKRPGFNVINDELKPNTSGSEGAGDKMDFLSNGIKFRVNSSVNASGTFIYMAFGQSIVGSNNVPNNAR